MATRRSVATEGARLFWAGGCLVLLALAAGCHSGVITSSGGDLSLLDPLQPRSPIAAADIAPAGVVPQVLHLDAPVTVTFTNTDRIAHTLESAPELAYGDCTEMNGLGMLQPGQRGSVTLNEPGFICAYHDAARPTDMAFQGIIVLH